jgi:repressor LexA
MLTVRQQAILDFIVGFRRKNGCSPSIPELQKAFGIRSPNGVMGHLLALESKGLIRRARRGSRQIDVTGPLHALRRETFDIPVFGLPPGGQAAPAPAPQACLTLDEGSLGFRPTAACFALVVRGNAMKAAGILDGDTVIVEPGAAPRAGRLVAAATGGGPALWRTVRIGGRWFLRAPGGRPRKLRPYPAPDAVGAVRAVLRRMK